MVYSVNKFRMYLIGAEFDILTDHQSLTFLLTTPFHTSRLMRWVLRLQEYLFVISHCRGADNIVADFFSCNFPGRVLESSSENYFIRQVI